MCLPTPGHRPHSLLELTLDDGHLTDARRSASWAPHPTFLSSTGRWPTVPVCPGLRGFRSLGALGSKIALSQANWWSVYKESSTYCLLRLLVLSKRSLCPWPRGRAPHTCFHVQDLEASRFWATQDRSHHPNQVLSFLGNHRVDPGFEGLAIQHPPSQIWGTLRGSGQQGAQEKPGCTSGSQGTVCPVAVTCCSGSDEKSDPCLAVQDGRAWRCTSTCSWEGLTSPKSTRSAVLHAGAEIRR